MKKWILSVLLLGICSFINFGAEILSGKIDITHKSIKEHRFRNAYIFVVEVGKYFEVHTDGAFSIEDLQPGNYTLRTYVPGFTSATKLVSHPMEDRDVIIPISLQLTKIEPIVVSHKIPSYVLETQRSISPLSDTQFSTSPGADDYNEAVSQPDGPDINVDIPVFMEFLQTTLNDEEKGEE